MLFPAAIELNGITYRLEQSPDVVPFREYTEKRIVQSPDIAGESRHGKNARPDLLYMEWDDWSKGEGQQYFDAADEDTFKKYYYSTAAVDVITVPGTIALGYAVANVYSFAAGTFSFGPYLVRTRYNATNNANPIGALVDNKLFTQGAIDTWTDRGNVAANAGNVIAGPGRWFGGYIYAAYKDGSGGASSSAVRRIIWDGTTLTQATFASLSNYENPILADNRLYVVGDGTGQVNLQFADPTTTLPAPVTLIYAAKGSGSEAGVAAIGNRLHIVTQYTEEEPHVHIFDGAKGFDRFTAPLGFRMDTTPYDAAVALGDVLWLVGYQAGTTGYPSAGMVCFVAPGRTGTIGLMREGLEANKIQAAAPGFRNRLIFASNTGRGFVYDISQGGVSQLFSGITSGEEVTSILYFGGYYYFATRAAASGSAQAAKIYRSTPSGSGKFPSASTVYGSWHDFDYPQETKVLHQLVITCEPLPSGASAEVQIEKEDGTLYTTDAVGNTMSISGSQTKVVYNVSGINSSGASVSRTAYWVRMRLVLKTSDTSVSPRIRSVTLIAYTPETTRFYDVAVALEDNEPYNRQLAGTLVGSRQYQNLRNLVFDSRQAAASPIGMRVHFVSGSKQYPVDTTLDITGPLRITVAVEATDIRFTRKGNAYARVVLRELNSAGV